MSTNGEIVQLSSKLLVESADWKGRYEKYASDIQKNGVYYAACAKKFRVSHPLVVYSSIGRMRNINTCEYDLRFGGQSVGRIEVVKGGEPKLNVSEKQAEYIRGDLGLGRFDALEDAPWGSSNEARKFRKLFSGLKTAKGLKLHSEEHRIESRVLEEFAQRSGRGKLLRYIQPVRLGTKFFQLVTPFKGSRHIPTMSRPGHGGGIDILARVTHKNNDKRIAIIELKDENKAAESQEEVMKQALIYATFIAHLLRSDSGHAWWNIFGESNLVSEELRLDVVSLMPKGDSKEGKLDDIYLKELNTTLHLYTLYYSVDGDGNPNGFEGSFTDDLMQ